MYKLINFVNSTFYSFYFTFSCPVGQRRLGATRCIDQDECEDPTLCSNGATCINLSSASRFRCICQAGWTGRYCDEGAAVLMGGKDFIIVFVFCILSLLSKYSHFILFCKFFIYVHLKSIYFHVISNPVCTITYFFFYFKVFILFFTLFIYQYINR